MAIDWSQILSAAIPAATSIGTTVIQNKGAHNAANTQTEASKQAMALLAQIWAQQQQSLQPYQYAGQAGLAQLMRGLGIKSPSVSTTSGTAGQASPYSSTLNIANSGKPPSALNSTGARALTGAATGAAVGSALPVVGTAIGAGVGAGVGALTAQFHKGSHEADSLVPIQNQVSAEVDRITKAVDQAKQNGTLTQADLQQAISTVQGLQKQFGDVAGQYGRAGPGGVDTLAKYFNPMLQDWQGQLASLPAGNPASQEANGGPDNPNPNDPNSMGFGALNEKFSGAPGQDGGYNPAFKDTNHPFTMADFEKEPGYDFRKQEGANGVLAQTGPMLHSGGTLKALDRYNQSFASNEYQNAYNRHAGERAAGQQEYQAAYQRFSGDQNTQFNRLLSVSGLGQTANQQSIAAGNNYGTNATGLITDSGNAQAGAEAGSAGNWAGVLNTAGTTLQQILAQQKKNAPPQNSSSYGDWQGPQQTFG